MPRNSAECFAVALITNTAYLQGHGLYLNYPLPANRLFDLELLSPVLHYHELEKLDSFSLGHLGVVDKEEKEWEDKLPF